MYFRSLIYYARVERWHTVYLSIFKIYFEGKQNEKGISLFFSFSLLLVFLFRRTAETKKLVMLIKCTLRVSPLIPKRVCIYFGISVV